jgi:hypothetical protein
MEIERRESKIVAKRRSVSLDRARLLEKCIKIPDPEQFFGHKRNKYMISMLSGCKIGRTLLKKKIGLLELGNNT